MSTISVPLPISPRGNVLVIGASGVGKSTLINAVIGDQVAATSWGKAGTEELAVYESEQVPFRLIDSMGFEASARRQHKAVDAVKRWSKDCAKAGRQDTLINVIWFCVDGTAARLFQATISQLNEATSIWKSVPVIVVITKSYSDFERELNVRMVREAFEPKAEKGHLDALRRRPDFARRLRAVIPVVAQAWPQSENNVVAPYGIDELIERTCALMPEGLEASAKDLQDFVLARRRALSQGVIAPCVATAAVVGALPLPIADAMVLAPVEAMEVSALAKVYGLDKRDDFSLLSDTIVDVGTVSVAAKGAIGMLKAIPGINVAAEVLNACVAGSFVAALGEGCVYVFERICTGRMDPSDLDEIRRYFEGILQSQDFLDKTAGALRSMRGGMDPASIAHAVYVLFARPTDKAGA